MIKHLKAYKLTYSALGFLVLLSLMQGAFNYKEKPVLGVVITASSQIPDFSQSPNGILGQSRTVWHVKGSFPQWVQFKFKQSKTFTRLAVVSQSNSPQGSEHKRSPKTFKLQGSHDGKIWRDLLQVTNAVYERGDQWLDWNFENDSAYQYYRIYITANNGDPDLLTIPQIRLE